MDRKKRSRYSSRSSNSSSSKSSSNNEQGRKRRGRTTGSCSSNVKSTEERTAEWENVVLKLREGSSSSECQPRRVSYKTTADFIPLFDPSDRTKTALLIIKFTDRCRKKLVRQSSHLQLRLAGMQLAIIKNYAWFEISEKMQLPVL